MVSPIERHAALDAELERRGWTVQWDVDVLVAPLAAVPDAAQPGPPVALRRTPDPGWLAAWAACEARALAGVQAEAEHVLAPLGARAVYALAGSEAEPAGVGLGVTVGSWCGIFAMATHPDARGRGVGSAVLRSLAAEARRRGAVAAYLQVVASNAAAQALYARHGFRRSHGYRTRVAPAAAS
jgi:ribosomal protein S18 acetylase RimI-like enzyme